MRPPLRMASLKQLYFSFAESAKEHLLPAGNKTPAAPPSSQAPDHSREDEVLQSRARDWLAGLGLHEGAKAVRVEWNSRLRSTAGYAKWPEWLVELNPRL